MNESESRIDFSFGAEYADHVLKYDATDYYRELFSAQPGSKAVDFIAASAKRILLIEVKNCLGNEAGNRWRISNNNKKRDNIPTDHDIADRDSLDIEVSQKTCMTLAALLGVYSQPNPQTLLAECVPFAKAICSPGVMNHSTVIYVILVLDGKFGCHTRSDDMICLEIQRSLKKKLKWLKCEVLVTDSSSLANAGLGVSALQCAT